MDHSVHGYLSRRTTAELEALLKNSKDYQHVFPEILEVLAERKRRESVSETPQNNATDK